MYIHVHLLCTLLYTTTRNTTGAGPCIKMKKLVPQTPQDDMYVRVHNSTAAAAVHTECIYMCGIYDVLIYSRILLLL